MSFAVADSGFDITSLTQSPGFDAPVPAVEDIQKTSLVVAHDTLDAFALQVDIETLQSDLEKMRLSSSILWSPDGKMTVSVGTQHDMQDADDVTVSIGTAFAF